MRIFFLLFLFISITVLAEPLSAQSITNAPPPTEYSVDTAAENKKMTESVDDDFPDDFEAEEFGDDEEDSFDEDEFGDDEFGDEFVTKTKKEIFDPLSGFNRVITSFNDGLYSYVLNPFLFKGYNYIPEPVRTSVNNFFNNLYYPVSVTNNILQLKYKHTGTETLRFVINSTVGILGLFDPARSWFDIEVHQEDFGQTMGYYGVGGGFHIVLPFFGPTNLRDFTGDFIDFYVNPLYYVDVRKYNVVRHTYQGWMLITFKEFNKMSLYTREYDNVRQDALDLYPFMRDLYEQSRLKQIEE